jgi:hypothetical protein
MPCPNSISLFLFLFMFVAGTSGFEEQDEQRQQAKEAKW